MPRLVDTDGKPLVPPALFGDAFGTRGDYSKGIFYAGRRMYLNEKEARPAAVDDKNPLRPPDYFLSRTQRQKQGLKSNGVRLFQKLDFKKDEDLKPDGQPKVVVRNPKKTARRSILLQRFQGSQPEDWVQEFQAGVHFWVNHGTGEVSERPPWLLQESSPLPSSSQRELGSSIDQLDRDSGSLYLEGEEGEEGDGGCVGGSGILNKELHQVFELLDATHSRPSGNTSPVKLAADHILSCK